MELETINVQESTVFGYPIQVVVKITDTEIVDVTHALRWDGKAVTLESAGVRDAINNAQARRGFGLRSP